MKAIMFVIPCTPVPNNSDCNDVQRAIAYLCTTNTDFQSAEQEALAYIKSYGWLPEEPEYAFLFLPELLPRLDRSVNRLYQQACRYGIAADFVAYPKSDHLDQSLVELRKLNRRPT